MIPCGLVLRSVGYRGVALPGLPFDESRGVIPNEGGRVIGDDGEVVRGVYCAGWIKRGPSGVIGTNKKDATETVELLLEDARAGLLLARDADAPDLEALLARARRRLRRVRGLGGDRPPSAPRRAARPPAREARHLGRAARRRRGR